MPLGRRAYGTLRKIIPSERHVGGVKLKAKILVLATLIGGSWTFSSSLSAHHSARQVYEDKSITLKGVVTGYEWANPHAIISITVKDDNGSAEQWHAEILPPPEMLRAGWTKESIKPGDQVTLIGRPGKNAQHILWLEYLVMPDGRKLGRRP